MEKKKKGTGTGLEQILLNVVIIEAFSIVENWLWFYYHESQVLPIIFGVLTAMMCCLLTINIYNCFMGGLRKGSGVQDSLQAQAVLYKQMKKLQNEVPESVQKELNALEANVFKALEEVKKNQLRSAKALMAKVEEQPDSGEPVESASAQDIEKITQMLARIEQTQEELKSMLEAVPAEMTADDAEEDIMLSEDELTKAFAEEETNLADAEEELSVQEKVAEIIGGDAENPNRELTTDEIEALFSGIN